MTRLRAWGAAQRALPPHDAGLRDRVLATARPSSDHVVPLRTRASLPWLSFAIAGLAVLAVVFQPAPPSVPRVLRTIGSDDTRWSDNVVGFAPAKMEFAPQAQSEFSAGVAESLTQPWPEPKPPYPLPVPDGVPIRDGRELLRTDYAAQLRTRTVPAHGERIATTVRGYGGRVDRASLSDAYGILHVALPADRLDALRAELRTLVRAPFFIETVSSENLLPQQRGLEERAEDIVDARQRLVDERDALRAVHERTIAAFRADLRAVRSRLDATRAEEPTDTAGIVAKGQRIAALERDARAIGGRIAAEDRTYDAKLRTFDNRIVAQDRALAQNADAQEGITDTVATVRGTITLTRTTLAGMARTYLRMYWLASGLIALALVAAVRWYRRTAAPLIP